MQQQKTSWWVSLQSFRLGGRHRKQGYKEKSLCNVLFPSQTLQEEVKGRSLLGDNRMQRWFLSRVFRDIGARFEYPYYTGMNGPQQQQTKRSSRKLSKNISKVKILSSTCSYFEAVKGLTSIIVKFWPNQNLEKLF